MGAAEFATAVKDVVNTLTGKASLDDKPGAEFTDKDYITLVNRVYEKRQQKYAYERQWFINLAFLLGHQHVEWSDKLRRIYEPKAPPWRVRHVANDIMPAFRKRSAKLNRTKPTLYISPARTNEAADEMEAKQNNELIEYWWSSDLIELKKELFEWRGYALSLGVAWLKVFWDPTIGEERELPDVENPEQRVIQRDGEIQVEAVSPFEIVFEPTDAKKERDIKQFLQFRSRTLDYIKNKYPDKGAEVKAEMDSSIAANFWQKIQGIVGTSQDGGVGVNQKDDKSAVVKELWIKPTKQFPKGKKLVVAGAVLLDQQDLPYKWAANDEPFIPFVSLYDFKVPGRIWGRSDIVDWIPIQKAKNELLSHIRESERLTSKPKVLLPKGSGVDNVTSEPGENIEYDVNLTGGAKPSYMNPASVPAYLFNGLLKQYQTDFANVSSQHEVSKGQVPPGITAGVAINLLQESDDTAMGEIASNYEESLERVGNMMLSITKQFYLENRTLEITGQDGFTKEFEYKVEKVDEAGNVIQQGTVGAKSRVLVQAGSAFPRSQTGKQAFLVDLYKLGALGPRGDEKTNRRFLKMLEMGSLETLYEDEGADRSQAEMENKGMLGGNSFEVMPYEDHVVHLRAHETLMKSKQFFEADPQIKEVFMEHRRKHQDFLVPPEEVGAGEGEGTPSQNPVQRVTEGKIPVLPTGKTPASPRAVNRGGI